MVTMTTTAQQRQQLSYMTCLVNSMVVKLPACRDADQPDMTELLLHAKKETISGKDLNFLRCGCVTRQPPNSWNRRHNRKPQNRNPPTPNNQPTKKTQSKTICRASVTRSTKNNKKKLNKSNYSKQIVRKKAETETQNWPHCGVLV